MPRYKLTLEYDGSRFRGWQRQKGYISVQETLGQAIQRLLNVEALVEGSGRTDAGVHALGQVAHVDLPQDIPSYRLAHGLNHFIRDQGVAVLQVDTVPSDFHARFSARGRAYEYRIVNRRGPLVLEANYAWHVASPLDVEKMQAAAKHLLGHHDFTSFRAVRCQARSPIRTLDVFEVTQKNDHIIACIESRSFLHNQVRIMMGTLKLVGEGRFQPDDIPLMLEARDRRASGQTAPPQGLYLKRVTY